MVEKGREFRVIVDEVGLDILKAARKTKARASIGRTGRGARRCAKDVGHVSCELKELEIRASRLRLRRRLTLRHWPLWRKLRKPNLSLGGVRPLTVRVQC